MGMSGIEYLNIGEVAKRSGVTVETVRYYEREKLLEPPHRSTSGYRQYSPQALQRLRFIQGAKAVGFSLHEIGQLLELRRKPGTSCSDIRQQAAQKVEDVSQKIENLERIRSALVRLILQCNNDADLSDCPILEALDSEEEQ